MNRGMRRNRLHKRVMLAIDYGRAGLVRRFECAGDRSVFLTVHVQAESPETCPALVLNADFRPLSYYPLSIWCWQDAIKAVFLDRVNIVSQYDRWCAARPSRCGCPRSSR